LCGNIIVEFVDNYVGNVYKGQCKKLSFRVSFTKYTLIYKDILLKDTKLLLLVSRETIP